jgi:hypothetical protein
MRRALLVVVFAVLSFPGAAWPQGQPVGPEFLVNTYTTGDQGQPVAVMDPSGSFVVVWTSLPAQDGSGYGVFGQRYDGSGAPVGPEFRVNSYTTGAQFSPSVTADALGDFVVVWMSGGQDGSGYGVFAQRYDSAGTPLGSEFRVNSYTMNDQYNPSVAADSSGNFVVVWTSSTQDGSSYGVFGQRYAGSGAPLGPEFRVNTYSTGSQLDPAVAADPAGNFVVAWAGDLQDGSSYGVFGQRYASSGAPVGSEFRVNTYSTDNQGIPAVAADASGGFVVAWTSFGQDGDSRGVFGQRYAGSGAPLGPEFRVNTFTTGLQEIPIVAVDASGNFVVVWDSGGQDGSSVGVFGQRYDSSGSPLGLEFRANTTTANEQSAASVAANAAGSFVVVWNGGVQDGSGYGVFGQRYAPILPVELMRFRVE